LPTLNMVKCLAKKGILVTVAILVCIFIAAGVNSLIKPEGKSADVGSAALATTVTSADPSPSPHVVAPDPTVTATRWYTSQPVIASPQNRLDDIAPVIQIAAPANHTVIHTSDVTLTVNVASYFWIIDSVTCKTDWQPELHKLFGIQPNYVDALNATITATFPQVPQGNHTITICANTHDSMHTMATLTFTKTG
jgi:hypothetical protein